MQKSSQTTAGKLLDFLDKEYISKNANTDLKPFYKQLKNTMYCPDFENIELMLTPNNIQQDTITPLWGVIVETRTHSALAYVIKNCLDVLNIPIQLFHSKKNIDFIMSTEIAQYIKDGKVFLSQLDTDDLPSGRYSGLLLSRLFWENLIGRNKILIFQTDSILCSCSDYNVDDFLNYDYIGSLWENFRPSGINVVGGNGGLSIRDWKKSLECLELFPPHTWTGGEDGYFAFHLELMGAKVSQNEMCAKFGLQTEFLYKSFGAHQFNRLSNQDLSSFLAYCPEGKKLLEYNQNMSKSINRENVSQISIVITCKNRLHHLKQTLPRMCEQNDCEVIVVDYGCTQGTSIWVTKNFPEVKLIRYGDDPEFCAACARNIGAKFATGKYLLFADADVIFQKDLTKWLLNNLNDKVFYTSNDDRHHELKGTFICSKEGFDKVQGYDEVFRYWGGEDVELYERLEFSGFSQLNYPKGYLKPIKHDDTERVFGSKEHNFTKEIAMRRNSTYRSIKKHLTSTMGKTPDIKIRKSIMQEIIKSLKNLPKENQNTKMTLKIKLHSSDKKKVEQSFVYTF